jgi:hypothetical protein
VEAKSPQAPSVALIVEQTYCPGVGLARIVTFQEKSGDRGPVQWTQSLSSYHVMPQS